MNKHHITPLRSGIRLVAIDLDGTLLDSRKELPIGAIELFTSARRAGLLISIITGRNACSVFNLAKTLHLSGPHASSGGSMIFGNGGRPIYFRSSLSGEDTRQVIAISRRWNLTIFIQSASRILMENGDHFLSYLTRDFNPCPPQPCKDILAELNFKPLKFTLYGDHQALSNARMDLEECHGCFHLTTAGEEDIEITPSGVNKGSALQEISRITGVLTQNIMVIGDSPNDLSMFSKVDLAVAVANASPEVKQAAKMIAPSNNEAGVLWAIQNLALSPLPIQ